MGCFSFICTECGEPVNNSSFSGENVRLSLLEKGKVIEEMQGQYDSYGRVFDKNGDSVEWSKDWGKVCDLMFDDDSNSGMSAAHVACIKDGYKPTKVSEDDPNQGWGEYNPIHTANGVENFHRTFYKYNLKSNQYSPNGIGKPAATYYYIVDDKGNTLDLKTLKPYRGKQMNRYAMKDKKLARNFFNEINDEI
jgi:hypothetical protein